MNAKHFHGPYFRQSFPFPDTVIYYITQNPSSTKGYQKLIQSCKYFFAKNSIVVIEHLYFINIYNHWKATFGKKAKLIDNALCKFWIIGNILNHCDKTDIVSSIIPRIYQCDNKMLKLVKQKISFNQFLFLTKKVEIVCLCDTIVKNEDDSIVQLEKLVEVLPNLKRINFYDKIGFGQTFTSKSLKNLLKIEHFSKLDKFSLPHLKEVFDLETFYIYMKKNKRTKISLEFVHPLSEAYINRLEVITNEICQTIAHDFKPPFINFPGIQREKMLKLFSLFHSHFV